MPAKIKLQSNDGHVYEVDLEIARKSITIRDMLDNLDLDEKDLTGVVTLPNLNSVILKKIVDWLIYYHHANPKALTADVDDEMQVRKLPRAFLRTQIHNINMYF